jgi:hypothetical protein
MDDCGNAVVIATGEISKRSSVRKRTLVCLLVVDGGHDV